MNRLICIALCLTSSFGTSAADADDLGGAVAPGDLATTPAVQTAEWAVEWWMPRHEQKLAEKDKIEKVDLLWIGDSITHAWETTGRSVWDQYYAKRNALNLGFSGDRTEQVLWRLENGEVDGLSPKLIVVMIGTNNTGHRQDPPDVTAGGVAAIIAQLKMRMPDSKVLLLGIFPRGALAEDPLRQINRDINEQLAEMADGERVFYLDIGESFLGDDGTLSKSVMGDLLHPGPDGYRMWAEAIEPMVVKLLDE